MSRRAAPKANSGVRSTEDARMSPARPPEGAHGAACKPRRLVRRASAHPGRCPSGLALSEGPAEGRRVHQ